MPHAFAFDHHNMPTRWCHGEVKLMRIGQRWSVWCEHCGTVASGAGPPWRHRSTPTDLQTLPDAQEHEANAMGGDR